MPRLPLFNINTDAAIRFTNQLEKLHRSGLPLAVRQTLNKTALDVKNRSLLHVTSQTFTVRKKNFFRVFSRVNFAQGFDIKSMRSSVGIFPRGNDAAENLETQEFGGKIDGRSFIPTAQARVGNRHDKLISKTKTLSNFKKSPRVRWGNKKAFMKAAMKTKKGGALIYGGMMLQVRGKVRRNGRLQFKTSKIYTYKKGRSVMIDRTGFMHKSAMISRKKMDIFYNLEAQKQISRIMKR